MRARFPAFNTQSDPYEATQSDPYEAEREVKVDVSTDRLRRWFGDSMLQQPVEITDLKRASVVDLMRLLDYPNDFVPVLSARVPDLDEPTGCVEVIDKVALTARLARSYLDELRDPGGVCYRILRAALAVRHGAGFISELTQRCGRMQRSPSDVG
jgi:hypothetical protein